MKNTPYFKYYRVGKNETAVTEVSANSFVPATQHFKRGMPVTALFIDKLCAIPCFSYALPPDSEMYYGYLSKVTALEKAKSGALLHINAMIKDVEQGIAKLKQYRFDHHRDLNSSLLESSIRRLEKEMNIK